jgi:hypothetical protein
VRSNNGSSAKLTRLEIALVILLSAVILIISLPFVPRYTRKQVTAELAQIRAELPLARARWSSHHLASYDLDVAGGVPLACMFDATFHALLIPAMFEQMEESLAHIDPAEMYLLVKFDPVYGFVTDFQIGCRNRQLSDCRWGYEFEGFRPLMTR